MPDNPIVWIAAIAVILIVVIVAIRKGYDIVLKKGDIEARFHKESGFQTKAGVSLGKDMKLTRVKAGNIVGVKVEGEGSIDVGDTPVNVLEDASIEDSEVGEIGGVEIKSDDRHDKNRS